MGHFQLGNLHGDSNHYQDRITCSFQDPRPAHKIHCMLLYLLFCLCSSLNLFLYLVGRFVCINSTKLYVCICITFVSHMYHMYQILCVNSPVCVQLCTHNRTNKISCILYLEATLTQTTWWKTKGCLYQNHRVGLIKFEQLETNE